MSKEKTLPRKVRGVSTKEETSLSYPDGFINKIICGDGIELMKKIPDGAANIVITSPPYNLKNSTGNGMKDGRGGKWANAALQKGYSHHHDCMPHDEYVQWQRDCLTEMMRIIPDDGAIFYNHKWRVQGGILQDRQDIVSDFPVRQVIIWGVPVASTLTLAILCQPMRSSI
jgi:site-specific DNA-methyltransferase (adenine-specific)